MPDCLCLGCVSALEAGLARQSRRISCAADDTEWPDEVLPDTGVGLEVERRLSAAFIRGQDYGTRASSLILVDHHGHGRMVERRFGPMGQAQGVTELELGGADYPNPFATAAKA